MPPQRGQYGNTGSSWQAPPPRLDPNLPDPFAAPPNLYNQLKMVDNAIHAAATKLGTTVGGALAAAGTHLKDRLVEAAAWAKSKMSGAPGAVPVPGAAGTAPVPGTAGQAPPGTMASTIWALGQMKTAIMGVTGTLLNIASKSSPTHVNTLMSSIDLVSAKMGSVFLPAIEQASVALQNLSSGMDSGFMQNVTKHLGSTLSMGIAQMRGIIPAAGPGWGPKGSAMAWATSIMPGVSLAASLGRTWVNSKWFGMQKTTLENLNEQSWIPKWVKSAANYMAGPEGKPAPSMSHLPKSQIMSTEDYIDKLITASLDLDELQIQILETQTKHMEEIVGTVKEIRDKPAGHNVFR